MRVGSKRRWDLFVGFAAAVISVAGLLLSLGLGNSRSAVIGVIDAETQKGLLAVATMLLVLVVIKAGIRYWRSF
jgi:hypothetical protein